MRDASNAGKVVSVYLVIVHPNSLLTTPAAKQAYTSTLLVLISLLLKRTIPLLGEILILLYFVLMCGGLLCVFAYKKKASEMLGETLGIVIISSSWLWSLIYFLCLNAALPIVFSKAANIVCLLFWSSIWLPSCLRSIFPK